MLINSFSVYCRYLSTFIRYIIDLLESNLMIQVLSYDLIIMIRLLIIQIINKKLCRVVLLCPYPGRAAPPVRNYQNKKSNQIITIDLELFNWYGPFNATSNNSLDGAEDVMMTHR